tara:strand:- start:319 stop:1335 length:1017 start_codon:yes stop_codon:yes gene_type:complete
MPQIITLICNHFTVFCLLFSLTFVFLPLAAQFVVVLNKKGSLKKMKIIENNPARVFAISLGSAKQTKTTLRVINYLCMEYNQSNLDSFEWSNFNYIKILELRRKLIDKNLKPNSVNSYISTIKSVSRESWRLNIISTETYMRIKDIQRVKGDSNTTGRALTTKELNAAIKTNDSDNKSIRDSAIIAVGYGAGLRCFELAQLQINDLNGNRLNVVGKGKVTRFVYLPTFSLNTLRKWLDIRGSENGAIFSTLLKGGKILSKGVSTRTIADIIDERCNKKGLERFTPHDLRRSFATNLLSNGVDVLIVQKLMRHANLNTTKIYDMRGEDEKIKAIESLPF